MLATDMIIIRDRPRLPVVNSKYLFRRLIDLYQADLLCDVGSFDGAHALMFARPGMKVVALEANPQAADAMANDRRLTDAGIKLHHVAAWNNDEQVPFNVISVPDGETHARLATMSMGNNFDPMIEQAIDMLNSSVGRSVIRNN
jgi:FkbM family methyltransferase